MKKYNNVKELNEDIKEGKIKENEIVIVDESIPSKRFNESLKTLGGLTSMFYNLAVASLTMNMIMIPMLKIWGKEAQKEIRNLKRRGIAVVEIRDKDLIKTYHPYRNIEKNLKEFVKKNNKWKFEKEIYGEVKTGKYILTRVYRKYYKKQIEEEVCSECGREY